MVSFLNKHLEFQDKVVNINKFLVNVTTWQYDKAQFDNGSKGANVRLQKERERLKVLNSVSKYALHKILKILNISPFPVPPEYMIGSQGSTMNFCV